MPSWSPDAKQIYYTGYKRENPDLYSLVLDTKKVYTISSRVGINSAGLAVLMANI